MYWTHELKRHLEAFVKLLPISAIFIFLKKLFHLRKLWLQRAQDFHSQGETLGSATSILFQGMKRVTLEQK